jgi:hypothetical protein
MIEQNFYHFTGWTDVAPGQTYVAISRAKTWNSLNIIALDPNAIKTGQQIIDEYKTSMIN